MNKTREKDRFSRVLLIIYDQNPYLNPGALRTFRHFCQNGRKWVNSVIFMKCEKSVEKWFIFDTFLCFLHCELWARHGALRTWQISGFLWPRKPLIYDQKWTCQNWCFRWFWPAESAGILQNAILTDFDCFSPLLDTFLDTTADTTVFHVFLSKLQLPAHALRNTEHS